MLNQIIYGDCINLMQNMQDESVEMTLSDIPYGVVNRESNGLRNLNKQKADIETFDLEVFLKDVVRVTKGSIYLFCSTEQVSFIRSYLVNQKLSTRHCVWEKSNASPMNGQHIWLSGIESCIYGKKKGGVFNEHCKNTIWRYPIVRNKRHPTEKPLKLFEYLITVSSNEGQIIFDPCLGSGTTVEAAINTKRQYIGFEKDRQFYEVAKERIDEKSSKASN